jgi:hypothetical protein
MITRRRIICFILSSVAVSTCSLIHDEPVKRIVHVKALADPSFRARNPHWEKELRGLVEAASDFFEREFAIRFDTLSAGAWPAEERIPSTAALLAKLKQEFPGEKKDGTYDLIIVFTAESISRYVASGRPRVDRVGNCRDGLGGYVVTTVSKVTRYAGPHAKLEDDALALIHELGHIFGAEHVKDANSIMNENFDYREQFDMKNRSVILKHRNCPFARQ